IGVLDGRVAAIADPAALAGADEAHDYGDLLILPGAIDAHFHSLGYKNEGFVRSTSGAAAGGVTTVNDNPLDFGGAPTTTIELRAKSSSMEAQVLVDFVLTAGVVSGKLQDMEGAAEGLGISAFKGLMHCTAPREWYGIWALEDWELYEGFQHAARTGLPMLVHAENENMLAHLEAEFRKAGRTYAAAHSESRPPITEIEAASRAIMLAGAAAAHLHVVHVSLPEVFDLIARARAGGQNVTGETTMHYLLLTEDRWKDVGMNFKINPPLRSAAARDALWDRLIQGQIDLVCSDHAPRDGAVSDIVFDNPSGTAGVETMLPLFFSEWVIRRGLPLGRLVELTSSNPARLLGIYPRKGSLQVGADADMVVFDPKKRWVVEGAKLQTGCKLTAFEGIEVTGKPVATYVRGKQVYADGEVTGRPGQGRFVPRLSWRG
ncbi:MAG: amidohydrolase family protein, partial [Chloroflexi bacterium]|nr:amidohydrolase family protein [Chloroflexota bacterium]